MKAKSTNRDSGGDHRRGAKRAIGNSPPALSPTHRGHEGIGDSDPEDASGEETPGRGSRTTASSTSLGCEEGSVVQVTADDTLTIPTDWAYTRAVTGGETEYLFESQGACPGYRVLVSDFRIRRGVRPDAPHPHDVIELLWTVSEEIRSIGGGPLVEQPGSISIREAERRLENTLGRKETQPVIERYPRRMRPFILGILAGMTCDAADEEDPRARVQALLKAGIRRAEMSPAGFALMSMAVTSRTPYFVDRRPWPQADPPARLRHLDQNGFESGKATGVVALTATGDDTWVVSCFQRGEIHSFPPPNLAAPTLTPEQLNKILSEAVDRLCRSNKAGVRAVAHEEARKVIDHALRPNEDKPPEERLNDLFQRMPGASVGERWLAVAEKILGDAQQAKSKPAREQVCPELNKRKFAKLIKDVRAARSQDDINDCRVKLAKRLQRYDNDYKRKRQAKKQ